MSLNGKLFRQTGRVGRLCTLICLMGFLLPAVWFTRAVPVYGMENEAVTAAEDSLPEPDPDVSCTIFLYICGSNLESKYGLASENIDEILDADIPDSTTVIIETGGTSRWWSSEWIAEDRLQRYIVRDHHLELLTEMENASMGRQDIFCDFLRWGQENYYADRNILVMWDHGGSSADGICYDENFGYDCLDRVELEEAFKQAELPGKFDLICLDTCYMGSLLTACLLSDYSRYMTASQTIVPGPGLDYEILTEKAAGTGLEEFGKILCDSFMTKCGDTGRADDAQLSFYDLDIAQTLVKEVNQGAETLKTVYEKTGDSFGFFTGARIASVAGPGSKSNVIDLMTFVNAMSFLDWTHHRVRIQSLLDRMVLYQVRGIYSDLNGVSIFFPLHYNEAQINAYESIAPADNYNSLLHEIYSDLPEEMITFQDAGSIGQDGTFDMEMKEESKPYLRSVFLRVWKESAYIPNSYILLADSEIDTYMTGLGRRLSDLRVSGTLPEDAYALDSHLLLLSVYSVARAQLYSAPVCVNGEDTSFSFVVAESLFRHRRNIIYTMLGSLIDENGLPNRETEHLKSGDRVAVYAAVDETGENLALQEEFVIEDGDIHPEMVPLPAGKYRCQYIVTDIIGRTVGSDYCIYEITEEDGDRKVQPGEIVPCERN